MITKTEKIEAFRNDMEARAGRDGGAAAVLWLAEKVGKLVVEMAQTRRQVRDLKKRVAIAERELSRSNGGCHADSG